MNITRRTVLKGIAATFLAPCVTLRKEIDRERLLQAFCDDEASYRYDLDRPFALGSLTYATDGRHMVRAELSNRCEEGERRLPKGIKQVWQDLWQPGDFKPFELPSIESLALPPQGWSGTCPLCDNRRISFGPHYPTDENEADSLPDWDVDTNTIRDTSCPLCHGKTYNGPCHAVIGRHRLLYSRLKPIAALPNVRVAQNKSAYQGAPLLFVADGFEGMAMGLREP